MNRRRSNPPSQALEDQEDSMSIINIRFRDLARREQVELERLTSRLGQFNAMRKNGRNLSSEEAAELERLQRVRRTVDEKSNELCDPLFVGLRDLFNSNPGILNFRLENHVEGVLRGGALKGNGGSFSREAVVRAALTLGLLVADQVETPPVHAVMLDQDPTPETSNTAGDNPLDDGSGSRRQIVAVTTAPEYRDLSRVFFAAIGEAQSQHDLAMVVLPLLAWEGDARGRMENKTTSGKEGWASVDAGEFARVIRALADRGVTADEPQMSRRVNEVLDRIQYVGEDKPVTELGIDLPDLDQVNSDSDIVPDNVRLMGPMICAAMFDELKAFQVVDKLVELFQQGMLPIGSGEAGKLLYKYWKDAPNRMSEGERRNFYAMTMGVPGGETSGMVNRDFNDLWIRFVSSVSSFIRQNEVDRMLRAALPSPISQQQVRKAARDLAANLSLHGYGMAYYAALDLQTQIKFMIQLLGDADIRSAYGAHTMWQVVDQVATLELGGAKTSSRYRTLATCGAIITAWLANNVTRIMRATGPIIDIDDVRSPVPRSQGVKATTNPTDYDLVNACELWLADTATSDTRIDELSQPREAPVMTSKPVPIPSFARDMLDGLPGIGMGLGGAFAVNGYAKH
jgi:hypothetical protein